MPRFLYVPSDALERRRELTAGAWDLFERYCFYRNRETGLCCPSLETLADDLDRTYRHVSDMKSELVQKGWIRRAGRHQVDLLVGSFGAPVVRSFGKNPDGERSTFGKNPESRRSSERSRRASFGKNPESDRPLNRNEQLEEKAEAAAAPAVVDPLTMKVDQAFVESVIRTGVYPENFVRWVYGKLRLHCLATGAEPVRRQLLHWLGKETDQPPEQLSLLAPAPAPGNFGAAAPAVESHAVRAPDPECRLCAGQGSRDGRECPCVLCEWCAGSGMEMIAGKGVRRCRCRMPQVATTEPATDELAPAAELEQERSTGS